MKLRLTRSQSVLWCQQKPKGSKYLRKQKQTNLTFTWISNRSRPFDPSRSRRNNCRTRCPVIAKGTCLISSHESLQIVTICWKRAGIAQFYNSHQSAVRFSLKRGGDSVTRVESENSRTRSSRHARFTRKNQQPAERRASHLFLSFDSILNSDSFDVFVFNTPDDVGDETYCNRW